MARSYVRSIYLRQFDAHIANSEYTAAELHAAAVSAGPSAWRHWRLRDRIVRRRAKGVFRFLIGVQIIKNRVA